MIRRSFLPAALLAAALAVGPSVAFAQSVDMPRLAEFYFDADASTVRPVLELKERTPAAVGRLTRLIERKPEAVLETAQLAHYAMQGGQTDVGNNLYARALARIDLTNGLWKPVKWNYGWDLYRAGAVEDALNEWAEIGARGVNGGWMPPTFALALWKLGRKDEAIRWYAAAVRTEPTQWSTPDQYAQLLPQWKDDERATLAEVQAAWAANPPKWP